MDGTKTCPYCGKLAPADAQFCAGCGRSISSPQQAPEQQPQQQGGWQEPPQQNYQQPQQNYQQPQQQGGWQEPAPYAAPSPPYGGGAKGQIGGAIQNRNMTDDVMSGIWILWPFVAIAIAGVILIALLLLNAGLWAFVVALPIGIVLYAILNYKLLKRMDEHRKREMALRMAIISYLKEKGAETQRAQIIANDIAAMESINQEAMYKEKERTPVLWTVLGLIPIVNYLVMYIMGEYAYDHDKRWHAFTQYTQSACQKLGINIMTPSWSTLKERPNIILLIGTLLLGIIMLVWYYFIIKDLNDHFQAQWQFEDQLMAQLR